MQQSSRYAELLAGSAESKMTFAVIPEAYQCRQRVAHVNDSIHVAYEVLCEYNHRGCGIFVAVNETDMHGRRRENITRIRACWTDLDHCSVVPVFPAVPTMVVRTAKGFHCYWVLSSLELPEGWPGTELDLCEAINRVIAKDFNGDSAACDAARVLRVPGFKHMKREPVDVTLLPETGPHYSFAALANIWPPEAAERPVAGVSVTGVSDSCYGLKAAQKETETLSATPTGQGLRNRALNVSAFKLGTLIGAGHLTEETAYEKIMEGCRQNGYNSDHGDRPTSNQVVSAMRAGMQNPRSTAPRRYELESGVWSGLDVSQNVPEGGIFAHKSGLVERCAEAIDRRIQMGFNPAPSPLVQLNSALGGGAPAGAVTLLGAPPGMGKSSLALAWCLGHADNKKPALFVSLELNELDLYSRACTLRTGHSWLDVRCGRHRAALMSTVEACKSLPIYSLTRHEIGHTDGLVPAIDTLSQKYGQPPLVVIDYLQLFIPPESDKEQWAVMGRISGDVAHAADDTGAPLICITALNRQSYNISDKSSGKPDKYLALSAAKQSGRLEYDAEVIMALQLVGDTEDGQFGWMCIAKNRSGGQSCNVAVRYNGISGNFYDTEEDNVFRALAREKEAMHKITMKDVRDRLLTNIDTLGVKSADECARAMRLPRGKVREALGQLVVDGKIKQDWRGELKSNG